MPNHHDHPGHDHAPAPGAEHGAHGTTSAVEHAPRPDALAAYTRACGTEWTSSSTTSRTTAIAP